MQRTFSKMDGSKDEKQWYYIDKDNNYVGPVNTHKLKQLKKFEYVHEESYVWSAHLSGWMLYNAVPEFADATASKQAGAPPSIGLASRTPDRLALHDSRALCPLSRRDPWGDGLEALNLRNGRHIQLLSTRNSIGARTT